MHRHAFASCTGCSLKFTLEFLMDKLSKVRKLLFIAKVVKKFGAKNATISHFRQMVYWTEFLSHFLRASRRTCALYSILIEFLIIKAFVVSVLVFMMCDADRVQNAIPFVFFPTGWYCQERIRCSNYREYTVKPMPLKVA